MQDPAPEPGLKSPEHVKRYFNDLQVAYAAS